jgi:muconolactone D-isomerase
MEFLVHISIALPPGMPDDERQALHAAERVQAASLAAAGQLVRLWRIPGTGAFGTPATPLNYMTR